MIINHHANGELLQLIGQPRAKFISQILLLKIKGGEIMSWKITGIYKIKNKITNEFYIGASVCIRSRYSTHMGRDVKKYKHTNRFYKEIYEYGKENFELEILEECLRENLLEREQFYYDYLKPTYNMIRPVKCSFTNPEVRKKSHLASQTPEKIAERK